ncbi:MAG: ATP-binding protein, partial [Bacteroidales bacterium]
LSRAIGLGQTDKSTSTRKLLMDIIDELVTMDAPLIIFDEGDKLPDRTLQYFITLYNQLEDRCGMIFLSTNYMKRRMTYGLQYNKQGYQEIDSRLGRRFFDVEETNASDVWMICQANGLTDEKTIKAIIEETQSCGYDLRRVKKAVHKAKRKTK